MEFGLLARKEYWKSIRWRNAILFFYFLKKVSKNVLQLQYKYVIIYM